jgi:threonylcarbamoyladenosine tRNA methylthiotransferase MtaB
LPTGTHNEKFYLCVMQKKRIAFHTLGCKLNFSETSTISRQFGKDDFEIVDFVQQADVYVIHTCSVTAAAERKCRASIKQAVKRNPGASVAVIGCAAQANPEMFRRMDGVSWVLGTQEKFRLGEIIEATGPDDKEHPRADYHGEHQHEDAESDISKIRKFIPSYSANDRTRSFFKVQDGCDYFCTYCSIPLMRGRSRSDTIANTLKGAIEIAAAGVMEIVLTGVNIGDFGKGNDEKFIDLLHELDKVDGYERIRISSIEPELLSDEIITFVANSNKILPHFHIPLQSGSDKILAAMRRKYPREVFSSRVDKIKSLMPGACIAADVIVGFPGETDEDFDDTYRFIEELDISYLHVFTYSERPGTKANAFGESVNDAVRKKRSQLLHKLSEEKKNHFYLSQKGLTFNVLFESDEADGYMFGFTENYIKVMTAFNPQLVNKIIPVRLLGKEGECCRVELVDGKR